MVKKIVVGVICWVHCSCVLDYFPRLVYIKNNSATDVVVCRSMDSIMNSDQLYYSPKFNIYKDSGAYLIGAPFPDDHPSYLFFFDLDSVYTHLRNKEISSIFKNSYLKKYEILHTKSQSNDTIFFHAGNQIEYKSAIK